MTEPERILLNAAMDSLRKYGGALREDGWDATMTVHTTPELAVKLTVPIRVGPIPVEASS